MYAILLANAASPLIASVTSRVSTVQAARQQGAGHSDPPIRRRRRPRFPDDPVMLGGLPCRPACWWCWCSDGPEPIIAENQRIAIENAVFQVVAGCNPARRCRARGDGIARPPTITGEGETACRIR